MNHSTHVKEKRTTEAREKKDRFNLRIMKLTFETTICLLSSTLSQSTFVFIHIGKETVLIEDLKKRY